MIEAELVALSRGAVHRSLRTADRHSAKGWGMRAIERFEVSLKAFVRRENQVLVLREADTGFWELPGGRIDQGEAWQPFESILARELCEELGPAFVVRMTGQITPLMRQRPTDHQHILLLVRLCTWQSGSVTLSAEHDEYAWVTELEARALRYPDQSSYATGLAPLWRSAPDVRSSSEQTRN